MYACPTASKEPCLDPKTCFISANENRASSSNQDNQNCRSNADCPSGQYCHVFHQLCLSPQEPITVVPVKSSARKCSKDAHCMSDQYCHDFWKICLTSQKIYRQPATTRPSWYCKTSKDCKIDERCHKRFHACYKMPSMPAVRRSTGNSRKCDKSSECGADFYCHGHFRICLKNKQPVTNSTHNVGKTKSCGPRTPCPTGQLCHGLWKICFTPPKIVTVAPRNATQRCQTDNDCKMGDFCHIVQTIPGRVVARQKRNIQGVCLPKRFQPSKGPSKGLTCRTNADCGPNKCCLDRLGICMAYKVPGEMCLVERNDFACPCASGSFCKSKGKMASPRRIINKVKLPPVAASYLVRTSRKRKHKVGKCAPSSL